MAHRAGIYVRISDDREGGGLGVARQEKDCREVGERLGWPVVEVYTDNDISAFSGRRRPAYEQLLDDVRAGKIDAIVAWHNDRLHRHPRELEDFISVLEQHKVALQTVRAGQVDLSTPSGRMIARQLGAVARYESEHKAERIKGKHRELASAGSPNGGTRPYGYRRIFDRTEPPHRIVCEELEPSEAAVVRECAKRALAGEALSAIARDLNTRGVTSSRGGQWSSVVLRTILISARIAGQREHSPRGRGQSKPTTLGEIVSDGQWPAIITPAESARLRLMLTQEGRRPYVGAGTKHLLTGLLFCGICGHGMVGRGKSGYGCNANPGTPGCGGLNINGQGSDAVVAAAVAQALASKDFSRRLTQTPKIDDAALIDEIADCRELLEQLATDHGEGLITRLEWMAARKPAQARIAAAERQLSTADTVRVLDGIPSEPGELQAWLLDETIPVSRRRAVIAACLDRIDVAPRSSGWRRFDPDRLRLVWRG